MGKQIAILFIAASAAGAHAETHHLKPTVGHPTFAVRPPVLTVKPGDVLLETAMEVSFRFQLRKGRAIRWPRLEDGEHLMVAGSARPLSDALRIAFVELIAWLEADYGFSRPDAYQIVSQLAVIRVANMVDPLYTVVAKFPKRFLPATLAR